MPAATMVPAAVTARNNDNGSAIYRIYRVHGVNRLNVNRGRDEGLDVQSAVRSGNNRAAAQGADAHACSRNKERLFEKVFAG